MPDPRQFTLSIALGNGAMQSRDDVLGALERVADDVLLRGLTVGAGGNIRDANGTTVGRWQVI